MDIWTLLDQQQEKFLRRKTARFDFAKWPKAEIRNLIAKMRRVMKKANGIGLSANQIGLDLNVFVAQVENKFYAVFNPKITRKSENKIFLEEGCLSVPETYGPVARPERITMEGEDANGKKIKIKCWGLLARVFQHETDHLNGILFIDKAKELYKIIPKEESENKKNK